MNGRKRPWCQVTDSSSAHAKAPRPGLGWRYVAAFEGAPGMTVEGHRWARGTLLVISALEMAHLPDGSGTGLQWHVSISRSGRRPRQGDVDLMLEHFGMAEAEEDNHEPGIARKFWLPVDPEKRVDCECKESEDLVMDEDGVTWSNPAPGVGPCRGCALERTTSGARKCTLHSTRTARIVRRGRAVAGDRGAG